MADVVIAGQALSRTAVTPAYTAIATGNVYRVLNNGRVILHFKKTGAGIATITFFATRQFGGLDVADFTITVPATTGDRLVADFDTDIFNDTEGYLEFETNEGTGLTAGVFVH